MSCYHHQSPADSSMIVRSWHDQGDHGSCLHPCHGQSPYRSHCRGSNPPSCWRWLYWRMPYPTQISDIDGHWHFMPRNPRSLLLLMISTTSVNTHSKSPLSAAARILVKLFAVSLKVPRWSAQRAKPVQATLWKRSGTSEQWWAIFERPRAWPTRSSTPSPRSCLLLTICWRRPQGWRGCQSSRTFLFLSYSNISANGMSSFAAGGVATPADAALMMQLGCDGVFVGSGICMSSSLPIFPFTFSASLTLLVVWENSLIGRPCQACTSYRPSCNPLQQPSGIGWDLHQLGWSNGRDQHRPWGWEDPRWTIGW